MQRMADRRQRDVDDRRIDEVDERDGAQQQQRQLAATRLQERWL